MARDRGENCADTGKASDCAARKSVFVEVGVDKEDGPDQEGAPLVAVTKVTETAGDMARLCPKLSELLVT